MPRKPSKQWRPIRAHPLTFSPFARSVAYLASFNRTQREPENSKSSKRTLLPRKTGNFSEGNMPDETLSNSSDEDSEIKEVIQVDFVFFDPKPTDFHGVKTLLQAYLDDKLWDLSGFVDLILDQTTVGTVVKIEDDEDEVIYSVVAALNFGRYGGHKCFEELKEFLLKKSDDDVANKLRLLLVDQQHSTGLLVSQWVVNLPPQLLPHLYDGLFDEVSRATEDEHMEELRGSFHFKHYMVVTKILKLRRADQKESLSKNDGDIVVYIKQDDEIFHKLSSWSFSFPLHKQQVETSELKNYRLMGLVMAVEASKISTFRQELHSMINSS